MKHKDAGICKNQNILTVNDDIGNISSIDRFVIKIAKGVPLIPKQNKDVVVGALPLVSAVIIISDINITHIVPVRAIIPV